MDVDQATMYHVVRNNNTKALSAQVNGDINFNFGAQRTMKENIKRALVKKLGPDPRKKDVHPQTCKWLEKIPKFVSWNGDETKIPGLLWICGGPGKELSVVLGLLNQQLESESSEELYRIISDKFSGIEQDLFSDAYIADLWDCLEKIIRKRSESLRVYIVLDGLDQCDSSSRSHLASQLRKTCKENRQEGKSRVKVVIFSRPLDLHRQADLMIDLNEDKTVKWTEEDIRTIVKESCLLEQGEKEYCDILTKRANGTFLWVALAISLVDNRRAQQKIVDGDSAFLDQLLPIELDAMYYMMLLSIVQRVHGKSQCREMMEVFRCLAVSSHPLTKDEVGAITALDSLAVDDFLQAFQDILSITGKGSGNEAVELIHPSLKQLLLQDSSSLIPEELCWSVWPRLSSTTSWLRENCFQLWFLDYAVLAAMTLYFQGLIYKHPTVIFGFLCCLSKFASRAQRSSLLIGLFHKAFERLTEKTIVMMFSIHEKEEHNYMFERCIALISDQNKGLGRVTWGAENPGPLERKTNAEEQYRVLRYPSS
ncbi:hypothetical protein PITC_034830 [Penicillium italicum]|uniref:Nephrocystin 3-like N-terminal domain-containing protein n=1 Tax=Penicillium italicum TaxID=40296 RepID=A0A0A2LPD0_PENIT|nr:hypothetical protein PITC_034830 [Penicillium italicum]